MWRLSTTIVVCASLVSIGCEDPLVDPFLPGRHFTIYGFLDALESEHFVRVIPVRRSPELIEDPGSPHAAIDAVVTTTDLTSNVTTRWTHTLAQFEDGTYGHVFTSRLVVREGRRYRLVVERSDGARSVAETKVPYLPAAVTGPSRITPDSVTQIITWPDAGVPDRIDLAYCAKPIGGFSCNDIIVAYGRTGRKTEQGWEVPVALGRDLLYVRQQLGVSESVTLELSSLEMRFRSLDEAWLAPQGRFDPQVFAQPGALTNVEDGFGFWGSVARSIHTWIPEREALERMGYVPPA